MKQTDKSVIPFRAKKSCRMLFLAVVMMHGYSSSCAEGALKVYFVRHAEAGHNVVNRWKGTPKDQWPSYVGNSSMFTPKGKEQIAALTEKLKGMEFDFIAASPVWRVRNTILPYMMLTGQKGEIWPELAETKHVPLEWTAQANRLLEPSPDLFFAKEDIKLPISERPFFALNEEDQCRFDPNRDDDDQTMVNNLAIAQKTIDMIRARFSQSGKSILLAGHGNAGYTLLRTLTTSRDIKTMLDNTGIWMAEEQPNGSFKLKVLNGQPSE